MCQFRIHGQHPIAGEIAVGGAKNAVLPILAAVCLHKGVSEIYNCPRISDTFLSIKILKHMGCLVEFTGNTLIVDATNITEVNIPDTWVKEMRSSILFMGAMLGRMGAVNIAHPGGCDLGERAIGHHINGLKAMGATINSDGKTMYCTGKLKGAEIHFPTASVGATENIMLAAVLAQGQTTIYNAAKEPEVVDLARFLKKMGANIRGAGTSKIVIEGVRELTSTAHIVIPDRIVAGTYLMAAAMTAGEIRVTDVNPKDISNITLKLAEMGCKITYGANAVSLKAPGRLKALRYLETSEHPGFPTDMQSQFVAALAISDGYSILKERIFDSRVSHATGLRQMGADIVTNQVLIKPPPDKKEISIFEISGVSELQGTEVVAKDLRCGAALVLAGLAAKGETIVKDAKYVQRGYEEIEKALTGVGARIWLEDTGI